MSSKNERFFPKKMYTYIIRIKYTKVLLLFILPDREQWNKIDMKDSKTE